MAGRLAERDGWLFLPLEVEALVPDRLASLTGADASTEAELIEGLITGGDGDAWFRYLRSRADVVARVVAEQGPSEDANLLSSILRDQYVLGLAVRAPNASDASTLRRLEELVSRSEPPATDR